MLSPHNTTYPSHIIKYMYLCIIIIITDEYYYYHYCFTFTTLIMDHFDDEAEREAFYRNIHHPVKAWFNGKGARARRLVHGLFPRFWQVCSSSLLTLSFLFPFLIPMIS